MASGTLSMTSSNAGDTNGYKGRVTWSSTIDSSANQSVVTLTYQVQYYNTALPSTYASVAFRTSYNLYETKTGKDYSGSSTTSKKTLNANTWVTIGSATVTVSHNSSGEASLTTAINFTATAGNISLSTAAGSTIKLDKISKRAWLSSAPNFTDADNPTIKYYRESSSVTNLRACISLTGAKADVPYRTLSATAGTYTFELTDEERQTLIDAVTDGVSTKVIFYLKSDFGGTTYTSTLTRTFSLTDSLPSLDPVVVDMNSATSALTDDINTLVRHYSTAACQFNATAKKGATITSYLLVNGSQTRDYDIASIDNVESGTFDFTVTDSRGNSATKTITTPFVEYFAPTCNQEAKIELSGETQAKATIIMTGEWFNDTFGEAAGAAKNTLKVGYRYKVANGEYSDWEDIDYLADDNDYKVTVTPLLSDYTKAYTFQCHAYDLLNETVSTEYTVKLIPIFDWGEDDFNFNVPVSFQGDQMADFIIEQGTASMGSNGTWHWSKWKSGKAECYGTRNFGNMAISNAWGGGYFGPYFTQDLPSIFSEAPTIMDISIQGTESGYAWVARHGMPTTTDSGEFTITRFSSGNISQVYISFHAIGKWK